MAISYLWTVTGTGLAWTNYSVDLTPLWLWERDIVLVVTWRNATTDWNPWVTTTWYTEILDIYSNDTYDANLSVNRKIMWSSPDTSVTCIANGVSNYANATVIYAFRDVDQTTPIDVTSTSQTYTNWATPTAPAITPVTTGSVIVIWGCIASTTASFTPTAPSWYWNLSFVNADDTGADFSIALATKGWASWTETPWAWGSFSTGLTADSGIWFTVVLRPLVSNNYFLLF